MKHLFNDISSEEKNRILEMHKGYADYGMINENQANDMAKNAISKSKQADIGIKNKIINCIKKGSYKHLMVLTTGAGSTALGALAVLFGSGVGTVPALILMAAGAIITTKEGMMTTSGSGRGSVNDELKQLYMCLKGFDPSDLDSMGNVID
jgi:hypothetical protein